jgi:hypothetical protein
MNYNENYEDNIRQPDKVIKKQIIPDMRRIFDKELEEALYLSMKETIDEQKRNLEYEEQIMNNYLNETCKRREKFYDLLFDLNKVSKFDKTIKEIYQVIEPMIETYCNQFVECYNVDEETYTNIFKTLSTIRTNKKNIENLKTIILLN